MAVIDHMDLTTKHIYLAEGVKSYHPVDDIYREIRMLRRTNDSLRGFDMPVVASGNVAKGGGKYTPRLATFCHGWKIVPEDVSHILNVTGEQITDEGEGGTACFDLQPLSANSKVIINYEPPLSEIIRVETGVSGLTSQESEQLASIETIWDHAKIKYIFACIKNKKILRKIGSTWHLTIRNDTDTEDILRKALKNRLGDDLKDFEIGTLAAELASDV